MPRVRHLSEGDLLDERYRLGQRLGAGSMAEVWRALDEQQGAEVAVKVLAEILALSQQARARFEREAQSIGSIKHPNVVALLGHGQVEDGRPYLVMELVAGETLDAYLSAREELLGAYSALVVGTQILAGVGAAHEKGIIHRDLKPANVLLAELPDGRKQVKVVDFGVAGVLDLAAPPEARLTRAGSMLGSPRYMPLELARSAEDVDVRCDVFGVGAVLYHALTGSPPFPGEHLGEIMKKVMAHAIPPLAEQRPDLPAELVACIERALGHRPEDRYPTAAAMQGALQALLAASGPR